MKPGQRLAIRNNSALSINRKGIVPRIVTVAAIILSPIGVIVAWFGIVIWPVFFLAYLILKNTRKKEQLKRDSLAKVTPNSAIYLRTFWSDERVRVQTPFLSGAQVLWTVMALGPYSIFFIKEAVNLEELVARTLGPYIDTIQVGGSQNTISGPRAKLSDNEWKLYVSDAINVSRFIVLTPLIRQQNDQSQGHSTIWEISELANTGNLRRTALIMPPSYPFTRKTMRRNWELARLACEEIGVYLPHYDDKGLVFSLKKEGHSWIPDNFFATDVKRRYRLAQGILDAFQEFERSGRIGKNRSGTFEPSRSSKHQPTPEVMPDKRPNSSVRFMLKYRSVVVYDREISEGMELTIGRTDLETASSSISRTHIGVMLKQKQVFFQDLGSTNGTRLNGLQLAAHRYYLLRDGDRIYLADIELIVGVLNEHHN